MILRKWAVTSIILLLLMSSLSPKQVVAESVSNAKGIPILMYHKFDAEGNALQGINTSPLNFKEQLQLLKANGYTAITTEQLMDYQLKKRALPEKPFMITLDDGYESVYTEAFPILQELEMPAVLFVITSHIESGERFGVPMMTWEQMKEMSDSGLIEIGNHTHDFHWRGNDNQRGYEAMILNMTKDGKPLSDERRFAQIVVDLTTAHQLIEENVGVAPISFSYPYGVFDDIAEKAVKKAGYGVAHSIVEGANFPGDDLLRLKRTGINDETNALQLKERIETYVNEHHYMVKGWSTVYNGGEKVEVNAWLSGEQHTSKSDMQEAKFSMYRQLPNGQKELYEPFGEKIVKVNDKQMVYAQVQNVEVGKYAMKITMLLDDNTELATWKEFEVKEMKVLQ